MMSDSVGSVQVAGRQAAATASVRKQVRGGVTDERGATCESGSCRRLGLPTGCSSTDSSTSSRPFRSWKRKV